MSRRSTVGRVAFALAIASGVAVLSATGATAAHSKKAATTLTIWTWVDDQLKTADAGFTKAHPDIDVKYVHVASSDLYQKVQLAAASGGGLPDLIFSEDSHVAQLIKLGVLADLTARATPYKSKIDAYKWNEVTAGGRVYSFPWDAGPVALYYRRDVFQKAGVNPNSLKTWDAWLAAGAKIKAKTGASLWPQAKAQNDARFFETLLWQQGSGYVDAKGNVTIDKDPRATAALNVIAKGWKSGVLSDVPEWTDAWYKAIQGGDSATLPMAAWMSSFLKTWLAADNKGLWGVVPLPAFKPGGSTSANDGGSDMGISKSSPNQAAAWTYIQYYLGRADVQSHMWQATDLFPSLLTSWRSPYPRTADPYYNGQKVQQVFTTSAKNIPIAHVYSSDYQQMNGIMSTHIQKVGLGQETVAQALKNAAAEIRSRTGRH